jgi:type I restriction enzyme S subunit
MTALTLGDVLREHGGSIKTGPFGTTLKATEYVVEGAPVISVGEVGYGSLRLHGKTPRVGPETISRLAEYVLRAGDVVFGRKGAVDRSAWVKPHEDGYFLGSDGIRLRFDGDVDSRFMAYQLQSADVRDWLLQHAAGTTMLSLNQPTIERIPVTLPSLAEQRGIAEVLGALDDKIAANTTFITRCEALAHAKYTSAIRGGLARPLSELARFVNGKSFTKDASGAGRVVIRIAELNSGLGASTVYNDIDVADDHVARPGDLLFAWSGSLTVHRWFRPEGIVNQHIFKVIPDQGFPMWLVHQALLRKLAEFKGIAADKATTMGHIQRRHLDEDVLIPAPDVITSLDQAMRGLWDRALAAEVENEQLSSTRDELLPLLMSGKVTVKDAEPVVGEVLG